MVSSTEGKRPPHPSGPTLLVSSRSDPRPWTNTCLDEKVIWMKRVSRPLPDPFSYPSMLCWASSLFFFCILFVRSLVRFTFLSVVSITSPFCGLLLFLGPLFLCNSSSFPFSTPNFPLWLVPSDALQRPPSPLDHFVWLVLPAFFRTLTWFWNSFLDLFHLTPFVLTTFFHHYSSSPLYASSCVWPLLPSPLPLVRSPHLFETSFAFNPLFISPFYLLLFETTLTLFISLPCSTSSFFQHTSPLPPLFLIWFPFFIDSLLTLCWPFFDTFSWTSWPFWLPFTLSSYLFLFFFAIVWRSCLLDFSVIFYVVHCLCFSSLFTFFLKSFFFSPLCFIVFFFVFSFLNLFLTLCSTLLCALLCTPSVPPFRCLLTWRLCFAIFTIVSFPRLACPFSSFFFFRNDEDYRVGDNKNTMISTHSCFRVVAHTAHDDSHFTNWMLFNYYRMSFHRSGILRSNWQQTNPDCFLQCVQQTSEKSRSKRDIQRVSRNDRKFDAFVVTLQEKSLEASCLNQDQFSRKWQNIRKMLTTQRIFNKILKETQMIRTRIENLIDEKDVSKRECRTSEGGFEQMRFDPLWHVGLFGVCFLCVFTSFDMFPFFCSPRLRPSQMSRTMRRGAQKEGQGKSLEGEEWSTLAHCWV